MKHFNTAPQLIIWVFHSHILPSASHASPKPRKTRCLQMRPDKSVLSCAQGHQSSSVCVRGPFRIGGVVLFPAVSQPTSTRATQTPAGAETLYFWSLHRVPCYDYLKLAAFDSFAATLWNPSILVGLLRGFSCVFRWLWWRADRHSMPALKRSTPTLFHPKKYIVGSENRHSCTHLWPILCLNGRVLNFPKTAICTVGNLLFTTGRVWLHSKHLN